MSGRKLKNRSHEFLGVDQKVWLGLETTGYGDNSTDVPAAADAVDFVTADIKFDIPREDSPSRSGRSVVARLSGKKTVEVKMESHIIPGNPDAFGRPTLPPMHPLLLTAFGDVDLTDPAKIKYKLSRFNSNSARILEETTHYSRLAVGVICDALTFKLPGDGKATMSMDGFAQDAYMGAESNLAIATTGVNQVASVIIQDLTFTSKILNSNGNLINIEYIGGGVSGSEVVTVLNNKITVQIETGASFASDIKDAIEANVEANNLVAVTVSGTPGDTQVIQAATFLVGGLGANEASVTLGHGFRYEVDSYVDFIGLDGNTMVAQKRKVVAVGDGVNANIIEVDGAALPPMSIGTYVIGHAPETFSPITAEYALLGLKGSFSVAGYNLKPCEILSAEIGLKNNYTKKDFAYGTSKICGYIPDKRREVSVKVSIILNKDTISFYMRNKQFVAENLTLTLEPQRIPSIAFKNSTGRTFKFSLPRVEFNIPAIQNPSDKFVSIELEGKALALSADDLDTEFALTIE